jgi:DNA repair protein RadC
MVRKINRLTMEVIVNEYRNLLNKLSLLAEKQDLKTMSSPSVVIDYLIAKNINNKDIETMNILYLNVKNKIIENYTIEGTIDRLVVYPREILKKALLNNAKAIIISHNHPSGEVDPSVEDIKLTNDLKKCCKLFNISLLDHIITCYGSDNYFSFQEKSIL